jgi:serine/threonine protein kinase
MDGVVNNGSTRQIHDHSGSSDGDAQDLERIREWMDRSDWDILDESTEVLRDKEICIQLLSKCYPNLSNGDVLIVSNVDTANEKASTSGGEKPRFSAPEFLGVGAFGIVFSVHDELLKIDVAIKILRPSKSTSHELRNRFIGEAQVTASLCHPGIVRVYDTGLIGGLPYITSAKLEGGTLADFLGKAKPLTVRQAAWVVARISNSVQFAHSKAILHRDIKPNNILLAPCDMDGSEKLGFEPMLTDFGLAKRLDRDSSISNRTQDGRVLGTARYMSPEQARGAHSEVGTVSDVFSLGIILYQLLIGKVPFDAPLDQTIRTMISEKEPMRPRLIDRSIPADLEAVVLKCLAKEPEARYQSANDLALDLERFLRREPVAAKKSTLLRRWCYTAWKHPVIFAVLTTAFLTNCVALIGLSISLRNERIAAENERLRVIDLATVYTKIGDDVFAGRRIKEKVMLDFSLKIRGILDEYLLEHATDEKVLHLKSVLCHFQSIVQERMGSFEQAVAARTEVLAILEKLLELHPDNDNYRFQHFFSQRLLAGWLVCNLDLKIASLPMNGMDLLEKSHLEIERLAHKYPEKIAYQDALAATKWMLGDYRDNQEPGKGKKLIAEAISVSETLWREHSDRPAFAKYAILGHSKLARYALKESDLQLALSEFTLGIELYKSAWQPIENELWVVETMCPVLDAWADVLVANQKWEQTLSILEKSDQQLELLLEELPMKATLCAAMIKNGLNRLEVQRALNNHQAASLEMDRLVQFVEKSKSQEGFFEAMQDVRMAKKLPEPIESLFKN